MPKNTNIKSMMMLTGATGEKESNATAATDTGKTKSIWTENPETVKNSVSTYTVGGGNQKYIDQLNDLYGKIMNGKPFSYDINGDMLYRQMADQYTQMGKKAMQDTMGQAAALTGGYGNSYAQQVGNQAYQQYLASLNEQVPALYQQAYNVWQGEQDRLMQLYQLAAAHPEYLEELSPKTYTVSDEDTEKTNQYALNVLGDGVTGTTQSALSALAGMQGTNALENWYYTLLKNSTGK
ncbi:MAG: hypothetical protein ACI4WX_11085 [Aristaeellaceae bacterium]